MGLRAARERPLSGCSGACRAPADLSADSGADGSRASRREHHTPIGAVLDRVPVIRSLRRGRARPREREPHDLAAHLAELPVQRPGVVRQPVALADLPHLPRDLGVAAGRHVGEQVVLDLVAEVAGEDVEQRRRPVEVRRSEDLAAIPLAAGLVAGLLLGELIVPSGKCPQKMIANDQRLRARLAVALPASTSGAWGPRAAGTARSP